MHPLLRIAFALCPRSFRREYEAQIVIDAHGARWSGNLLFICTNIAWNGIALHAETLWRNLTLALRSLSHARTYVVVFTLTLALAIGANLSVATVLEGVLLNPLPYPDSSNLYYVTKHGSYGGWSYLNAHDYFARSKTVADLGISGPDTNTLIGRGASARLDGKQVDSGYFRVLGAHAQLGRLITAGDMTARVVVLSNEVWRSYFGRDPSIVGKRIDLGQTFIA
jgi:hypothetical protein